MTATYTPRFTIMCADNADPKRRCHDLVGLLADYVEHHLPPEVHADLEKHLSRCPQCVAQVKTYQSTVSLLKSITEDELPPELRCKLHSFLHRGCRN